MFKSETTFCPLFIPQDSTGRQGSRCSTPFPVTQKCASRRSGLLKTQQRQRAWRRHRPVDWAWSSGSAGAWSSCNCSPARAGSPADPARWASCSWTARRSTFEKSPWSRGGGGFGGGTASWRRPWGRRGTRGPPRAGPGWPLSRCSPGAPFEGSSGQAG